MNDNDSSRPNRHLPVVIINGLGAPHLAARAYSLQFRWAGLPVSTISPSVLGAGDIRQAARRVADHVEQVERTFGVAKVHLVGMSLGGLIGLYYLKCLGGHAHVDCFVSVGGPLSGASLSRLSAVPPMSWIAAVRQSRPDSDLISEIHAAPIPLGVRMYSVGTRGDVITPIESRSAAGVQHHLVEVGFFPVGHWCLFLSRANIRAVIDLLEAPR